MAVKHTPKQSHILFPTNALSEISDRKKNKCCSSVISRLWSKKILKTVSILLCIGIVLSGSLGATSGRAAQKKIVSVTDIHFNPFFDPTLAEQLVKQPYRQWDNIFAQSKITAPASYNQETNPVLLNMVLAAMKKQSRHSSAVLFTGDILAHDFNDMITQYTGATTKYERNKFIYKTMGYVSMKLKETFPRVPIYFSLGNNDAYSGDYDLVADGEFLHTTVDLFYRNFIKTKASRADFYSTYPVYGCYSIPFPALKQGRMISLNTIFFSANYSSATMSDPGAAELDWLQKELAQARQAGEKVWLLLHIPPGVNVYSTQRSSTPQNINVKLQWQQVYNARYFGLVKQYQDVITASFAGHTHMDDFRLIYDTDEKDRKAIDFIHITAAVTPLFGNNPAFQIIHYNANTGELSEIVTHYVDLKKEAPAFKQEYVYTTTYGITPDVSGLAELYPVMPNEPLKLKAYTDFYYVSSTAASIADKWQWYWCGIGNLTPAAYIKAYKQLQQLSLKQEEKK